LRIDKFIIYN